MRYYALDQSRLRFFGGTTNIWGGRCVPFDRIDFERRDWVPHSGWPISLDELDPWYRKAHESLELGEYDYSPANWEALGLERTAFSEDGIDTRFWRFDTLWERFHRGRCEDVVGAPNVSAFTHANLERLAADADGQRIVAAHARSLGGRRLTVEAQHFVIACGAIENARMLLVSDDVQRAGLGNARDQVGRWFMEHPHGRIARIDTPDPGGFWTLFRKRYPPDGPPVAPALVATEALQKRMGILNSAATMKPQRDPARGVAAGRRVYDHLKHTLDPTRSGRRLWHRYRAMLDFLQRHAALPLVRLGVRAGRMNLYLIARAEQAPNPDSRVVLAEERDALGMRRANLDWRLSALDKHSVLQLALALGSEFERLGLGRVQPMEWLRDGGDDWPVDPTVGNHPIGGYHHMGTTRMSAGPSSGVVDRHCCVHGIANLHVAGSSVFTTSGWANPTLTLLALAYRLGDRIDQRLRAPG